MTSVKRACSPTPCLQVSLHCVLHIPRENVQLLINYLKPLPEFYDQRAQTKTLNTPSHTLRISYMCACTYLGYFDNLAVN